MFFYLLLKYNFYFVFHQDSPGIIVKVKRNKLQNLLYNKYFSEIGEKHYTINKTDK